MERGTHSSPQHESGHSKSMYIASVCAGQALRALEALLTEIARLRLHGINDRQFEQVGNNLVHCHGTGTTSDHGWMVLQWLGWHGFEQGSSWL
jgi:hypothetical protein